MKAKFLYSILRFRVDFRNTWSSSYALWKLSLHIPFSYHWCLSIPTKNIRKLMVLWKLGDIGREHGMKCVKNHFVSQKPKADLKIWSYVLTSCAMFFQIVNILKTKNTNISKNTGAWDLMSKFLKLFCGLLLSSQLSRFSRFFAAYFYPSPHAIILTPIKLSIGNSVEHSFKLVNHSCPNPRRKEKSNS